MEVTQEVGHSSRGVQRRNMSFRATAEYQKSAKNHVIAVSLVPGIDRLHAIAVNKKGCYDGLVCRCDVELVSQGDKEFPPGGEKDESVLTVEVPRDMPYEYVVVVDPRRDAVLTVCDVVVV